MGLFPGWTRRLWVKARSLPRITSFQWSSKGSSCPRAFSRSSMWNRVIIGSFESLMVRNYFPFLSSFSQNRATDKWHQGVEVSVCFQWSVFWHQAVCWCVLRRVSLVHGEWNRQNNADGRPRIAEVSHQRLPAQHEAIKVFLWLRLCRLPVRQETNGTSVPSVAVKQHILIIFFLSFFQLVDEVDPVPQWIHSVVRKMEEVGVYIT